MIGDPDFKRKKICCTLTSYSESDSKDPGIRFSDRRIDHLASPVASASRLKQGTEGSSSAFSLMLLKDFPFQCWLLTSSPCFMRRGTMTFQRFDCDVSADILNPS